MSTRYDAARVRRSIIHFLVGKSVSSIAGFAALLLVVRGLSVADFAGYSVLIALVEVLTAVSGLGLVHAVLRFVPELYNKHYRVALRRFTLSALSVRTSVLVVLALLAWVATGDLSTLLGLARTQDAFRVFLLVVVLRSTAHFVSQMLESTLSQGFAQAGFTVSSLIRVVGMLYLLDGSAISLVEVVWVEAVSDAVGLVVLLAGTIHVFSQSTSAATPSDDEQWTQVNFRRVIRFAWSGYVQHLATLPFGGNTNRLVGGAMFGDVTMATFGFSQSLYEYVKRYLPTQLLFGLIRPVVVSRFSSSRDFASAMNLCDQALHVNLAFLGGGLAALVVSGGELLSLLSSGKYGFESAILLSALLILLVFETQRLILELLTQMVERYDIMILGNAFLSSSVLLGILGYRFIGAIAFPIANTLALVIANYWVIVRLRTSGYVYHPDWKSVVTLFALLVASVTPGLLLKGIGLHWSVSLGVTTCLYLGLFLRLRLRETVRFARELIGGR